MTLRTDLTILLADAGLVDVNVDEAVVDEHVRSSVYQRVVSVAAASRNRASGRATVAAILRDPDEMVAKTAVVGLVDKIAMRTTSPVEFRQWSTELLQETDRLKVEAHREFIRSRVHDWLFYLSIKDSKLPTRAELADVTDWMQRLLADHSTSLPLLALLTESGRTTKIRNAAKNRAGRRELRTN
jgi:hypothetical protein